MDINDPDKKSFCINCGKIGHISKKCLCPIISIGIICIDFENIDINNIISYSKRIQNKYMFSIDEINKLKKLKNIIDSIDFDNIDKYIKYLLIRRRNSLNYVEFIRGKYDINNIDYVQKTLNFISVKERNLIKNTDDFSILWNDLWSDNISNNTNEFKESHDKFHLLKKGLYIKKNDINIYYNLNKIINNCNYQFEEPEWGFPKGRRNLKEKNIECAKREFEEETLINEDNYNILNISPLEETYIASNNIKYKHIYYISQLKNKNLVLKLDKDNINQKIEIGDIQWFDFSESLKIIRDYNIEKKNIIINLQLNLKYTLLNFKDILNSFLENNKI